MLRLSCPPPWFIAVEFIASTRSRRFCTGAALSALKSPHYAGHNVRWPCGSIPHPRCKVVEASGFPVEAAWKFQVGTLLSPPSHESGIVVHQRGGTRHISFVSEGFLIRKRHNHEHSAAVLKKRRGCGFFFREDSYFEESYSEEVEDHVAVVHVGGMISSECVPSRAAGRPVIVPTSPSDCAVQCRGRTPLDRCLAPSIPSPPRWTRTPQWCILQLCGVRVLPDRPSC